MKRIIFLLIAVFMCITLASCGNANSKSDITQEEYDNIREGMTYEDVCKIIGGKAKEIELALSMEEYLSRYIEDTEDGIDKNDLIDSSTKEELKLRLEELAYLYLLYVENGNQDYIDVKGSYSNTEILEYWLPIEFRMMGYELGYDKYTWQGQKINPKAEYRGYAIIYFRDGIVVSKECKDLE